MNEEQKTEIKKLVHAEVRNALEKVLTEQEKVAQKVSGEAVRQITEEFDMMFGKSSRAQAQLEDKIETVKSVAASIEEQLSSEKSKINEALEKVTKLEYISLDSETVSKVRSFVKSPVKYLIKTIAGIE